MYFNPVARQVFFESCTEPGAMLRALCMPPSTRRSGTATADKQPARLCGELKNTLHRFAIQRNPRRSGTGSRDEIPCGAWGAEGKRAASSRFAAGDSAPQVGVKRAGKQPYSLRCLNARMSPKVLCRSRTRSEQTARRARGRALQNLAPALPGEPCPQLLAHSDRRQAPLLLNPA